MRKYAIFIIVLFFPLVLLSQDKQKGLKPDSATKENGGIQSAAVDASKEAPFNLEREIKFGREVLKNNGFTEVFHAYQAVRSENISSCGLSKDCEAVAPALLAIRYTGEGRCQDIKDSSLQQLCMAINSNNCAVASGSKNKFCRSFLTGDATALAESSGSLEIVDSLGFPVKKPEAALMLGVYNGFKQYNVMACEKYVNQENMPLSRKLACRVIFAPNPYREADDLTNDLALFFIARFRSKPELCDSIVDDSVKTACNDSSIKNLRDIW